MCRSIRLAVLVLLLPLATRPVSAEWFSDVQSKMGTRVEVQLWSEDTTDGERLLRAAMAEFDRIEAAMSTYRPESEISQVNAGAAQAPVSVSPELFALVDRALQLSATTGGAFDITYDSVGQLYDYRAGVRPADVDIEARLPAIDYRHIELDSTALAIRFSRSGVRINLGGIAKGHAVESVIGLLREAGIQHALASAGGDTRLLGNRRGKPWIVGIRDPDDEAGIVTRVALDNEAVSTSGDYERFFDEGEVRYHHIINPDTGRSATEIRSVTVIGRDATMTDGLSTSVFVLGLEKGLALIESLPDYEAIIIDPERKVRFSTGLDPR